MTGSRVLFHVKRWTGLDRAVLFSIVARGWSTCAGIATVLLIAHFLTRAEQGYYYTFATLAAAQIIFELGFSFVILQLAAHERVHLKVRADGSFEDSNPHYSRIASVLQQAVRWYTIAAVLMAAVLVIGGFIFFSHGHEVATVKWKLPWICVVLCSSITFQVDPVISFLEGCGMVVKVAQLRFTQAMLGSLLSWSAILLHHGLFAPAMLILGQAICGVSFLILHRKLLLPLLRFHGRKSIVRWSTEIWPFQWRIAVSWASSYFILQLMNPILFAARGPVAAGRMGMSISICNSLGALALSWVTTKAAPFGTLVAQRRYAELDRLFFYALWRSLALLIASSALLMGVLVVVLRYYPALRGRIVPLPLFLLVLVTINCTHVVVSLAYYLRAHKREPFLFFWIFIAVISAISMTLLARGYGLVGITIGYFACAGILRLATAIYVFIRKRKEWHLPGGMGEDLVRQPEPESIAL